MTQEEFTGQMESELRHAGASFDQAALRAFVEACFPLIQDDPNPGKWALEVTAGSTVSARE
jgi:hypothetical protein